MPFPIGGNGDYRPEGKERTKARSSLAIRSQWAKPNLRIKQKALKLTRVEARLGIITESATARANTIRPERSDLGPMPKFL